MDVLYPLCCLIYLTINCKKTKDMCIGREWQNMENRIWWETAAKTVWFVIEIKAKRIFTNICDI